MQLFRGREHLRGFLGGRKEIPRGGCGYLGPGERDLKNRLFATPEGRVPYGIT